MKPAFRSLALGEFPPDFVDLVALVLPEGAPTDPAVWAATIFSTARAAWWVRAAFATRNAFVWLLRIPRGDESIFTVSRVEDGEALISADESHLDFRAAVGVDTEQHLVRVTTVVRLNDRRGRIYFSLVKIIHPVIVQSMLASAVKTLTPPPPSHPVR